MQQLDLFGIFNFCPKSKLQDMNKNSENKKQKTLKQEKEIYTKPLPK